MQQFAINLNQSVNKLRWRNKMKQFVNSFQLSDHSFRLQRSVVEHKENVEPGWLFSWTALCC